ncbi:MAG: RNA polymerase sigma factor [Polyangiaceae bacterium]
MTLIDLEKAAAAVSAGDPSAFPGIVTTTQERLVRLSARLLGSVAEAEDAVQEAYLKAYRSLIAGGFDGRSKVTTWLHRIVLNTTLDAKRARKNLPPAESDARHESGLDGVAFGEARVALRELAEWLGALPEEQQLVLVLKSVEELSSAEIAEILRCSEGAVEQRLVRARAALRKMGADQ